MSTAHTSLDDCAGWFPAEGGAGRWCDNCGWRADYHVDAPSYEAVGRRLGETSTFVVCETHGIAPHGPRARRVAALLARYSETVANDPGFVPYLVDATDDTPSPPERSEGVCP